MDERNILTSAENIDGKKTKDFTVWVGDYNKKVEGDGESDHTVSGLVQHPDYY